MENTDYSYNGKLWRPCATTSDHNSFFHSAFGTRTNETEAYFDKHAKFRRMRWSTFLIYFENEVMPPRLANILKKCFSSNNQYKNLPIEDNNNLENYISDIMTNQEVKLEEVPIVATLENIRIVVLSKMMSDPILNTKPDTEILGSYPSVEKPKNEVVVCLEGGIFTRLSPVQEELSDKEYDAKVTKENATKINLEHPNTYLVKYEKGGSAGSKGVEYQVALLAVFLLNAIQKLNNWKISTENKQAGKFDDAVLEWSEGAILLQAKFKENKSKKITFDELISTNSKSDNFSIPKYFLSYQELKDKFDVKYVILCTNSNVDGKSMAYLTRQKQSTECMLHYGDKNCTFYKLNDKILPLLRDNIRQYWEKNCQDKKTYESVISDENLNDFVNRLQFYCNYPPGGNTEKIADELLSITKQSQTFLNQISSSDILAKIMNWFQDKNYYLTEVVANAMFSEIRTEKYFQKLEQYNVVFQTQVFNFQDATRIYHVTAEGEYLLQELKIYQTLRSDRTKILYVSFDDEFDVQRRIVEAFHLPQYTSLVIIWPKHIKEELISSHFFNQLKATLEKSKYKKVILVAQYNQTTTQISPNITDYNIINGSVNFEDLTEHSRNKLLRKRTIVFQGKDINLKELLTTSPIEDCLKVIHANVLEKIIKGEKVKVGSMVKPLDETIEPYYVDRVFTRNIKRTRIGKEHVESISETNIYEVNEKVVLISDVAGMGKTVVLKHLAFRIKKNYPDLWVIRIELNDYTGILQEYKENNKTIINIKQLLEFKDMTKLSNQLEKFVFTMNKKVVLMLDGVDEVSPDYTELVVSLITQCLEDSSFAKIFITTRPNVTQELEEKLPTKAFTLHPFTDQNRIRFFTSYWVHNLKLGEGDKKKCGQYAETLLTRTSSWTKLQPQSETHFSAIPLHVRMLAEIFLGSDQLEDPMPWEGCKEYLTSSEPNPKLPEKMNITKIYEMFVEKKRNVFKSKGNPSGNAFANHALLRQFEECLDYHRTLALEVLLQKDECELFGNYQQTSKDVQAMTNIGIVQKSGHNLQFIHRTFAEYFLAESVLSQLQLQIQRQNGEFQKFFFTKILLTAKFKVVRTFFDNFLQKSVNFLPTNIFESYQAMTYDVHLESNYYLIHSMTKEGCTSILRMILKCIDYQTVKDKEVNIPSFFKTYYGKNIPKYTTDNTLNIIKSLVKEGGVNIKDTFNRTPLIYAIQEGDFETVKFLIEQGANLNSTDSPVHCAIACNQYETVKLMVEQGATIKARDEDNMSILYKVISRNRIEMTRFLFENIKEIKGLEEKDPIIPYTVAYLGHMNLLKNLMGEDFNVDETVENDETIIFAAARGGQLDTIKYLVQESADINSRDMKGNTALHIISKDSSLVQTVELLINLGINVNAKNSEGDTALHLCINVLEMVELLIKHGADVNIRNNSGKTALCQAASSGLLETVKYLLHHGSDVDIRNDTGQTALHFAVLSGELDTVKLLVEFGTNIDSIDDNRQTPLHLAARYGHLDILKFLTEKTDANINEKDKDGCTVLHLAALGDQSEVVEYLEELGADINTTNNDGYTALHLAAIKGKLDMVKVLVELGINVNLTDKNCCTALQLAALNDRCEVVKYLLKSEADISIVGNSRREDRMTLHFASSEDSSLLYAFGKTTLHSAAEKGNFNTIKFLIDLGVDVNIKDNKGWTALHFAAKHQHLDIVKYLITLGCNLENKSNDGCTALHFAVKNGDGDMIELLLKCGVNVNIEDNSGDTLLHFATWTGRLEIVKFFLELGMDINVKNNDGCTPIYFAALSGTLEMIELLLGNGADAYITDSNGSTTVHSAASAGRLDNVKYLVRLGISAHVVDENGHTAVHFAVSSCHLATVKYLVELGVDVNVKSRNGLTALSLAVMKGRLDILKFLLYHGADIDIIDNDGCTLLHVATQKNQVNIVEFLMDLGVNVNARDNIGRTPLHYAALEGKFDILRHLVQHGAHINIADNKGDSVLHLAAEKYSGGTVLFKNIPKVYRSVVKFLVDKGADLNAKNFNENTAATLAESKGNFHLLKYLKPRKTKRERNDVSVMSKA